MNFQLDDTIAALGSPPGPGLRGVVRIGGPDVKNVLDGPFEPTEPRRWRSARVAGRHSGLFQISEFPVRLPVSVYLWPHRRSYTGGPLAELHAIGSPPLLEAVLTKLFEAGARPARPGEFTLRAFLAGRIDLMQAEAVLGVVDAFDHEELQIALRQLAGGISGHVAAMREDLIDLLADLEAGLDFVEEDIEFIPQQELIDRTNAACDVLDSLLEEASQRMQSTGRRRVVLAGLTNAGKSTLFNALAGHQAALVSEAQGTTRDYLSTELDLGGLAVELIDTAGWHRAADDVMRQALDAGGEQLRQADLILWCSAGDLDEALRSTEVEQLRALKRSQPAVLVVQTKCDLPSREGPPGDVCVSALSGTGLPELIARVASLLSCSHPGGRQLLGSTASRCRESLASTVAALRRAGVSAAEDAGEEIVAIEVREALEHLGRILGTVYTDDILDRIFSKFCIGK